MSADDTAKILLCKASKLSLEDNLQGAAEAIDYAQVWALLAIAENLGEACSWLQNISEKLERGL